MNAPRIAERSDYHEDHQDAKQRQQQQFGTYGGRAVREEKGEQNDRAELAERGAGDRELADWTSPIVDTSRTAWSGLTRSSTAGPSTIPATISSTGPGTGTRGTAARINGTAAATASTATRLSKFIAATTFPSELLSHRRALGGASRPW
jgi:hypothetical protein